VNNFYILLSIAAGAGVAAQAVINGRLRFILGAPVWAATAQFIVGLLFLTLFAALSRRSPTLVGHPGGCGPEASSAPRSS
jgi:uncharacterized membrane protein YdcZ (DUF606 family)